MANPLTDVLPAGVRKVAYAIAFVVSTAATIVEANHGDLRAALVPLLAAATSLLAASNV